MNNKNLTKEEKQIINDGKTPLQTLDLSVRAFNCLRSSGIDTVEKLLKMSKEDLMNIRNLGERCFVEIIEIKNNINKKENTEGNPRTKILSKTKMFK